MDPRAKPPSIPTLAIAGLICRLRNSKLIIDWHNYGWTILAGTRGRNHPSSTNPYSITQPFSPCTTAPPPSSNPSHQPFLLLSSRAAILARVLPTDQKALIPSLLSGTTRLLVSSTSWTPDEDFSLLLSALVQYANTTTTKATTPLLAVITGKGPQKEHYLSQIRDLTAKGQLPNVRIVTAFLPFADYAALLACADLGVCLHMSSSGVDLPMKVVDMFGAGLPVAAYCGYESFGELVKEGTMGGV
ncbi:mannosyltransferase [Collariella sp. IMI 366227]|nr:mannosyltransferase [Collariella sp. IMI 366227]